MERRVRLVTGEGIQAASALRTAGVLTILTYHSIDRSGSVVSVAPESFAAQMELLAGPGLRAISLGGALEERAAGGRWPDDAVVVTFDDGYRNVYRSAIPVLIRLGFGATIFLVTDHVGGRNDWAPPPPRLGDAPLMAWDEVREASRAGIELGGHTRSHPDLRMLCRDAQQAEIAGSKEEIERQVGCVVRCFAYPYGHIDRQAERIVASRFEAACTTRLKRATREPLSLLPRVDMVYFRDMTRFRRLVEGRADGALTLRRAARAFRRWIVGLAGS